MQNQVKLICAFRSQDTPWGVGTGVARIRGFLDAGMVFPLFFGKNYGCWLHGFLVHISIKVVVFQKKEFCLVIVFSIYSKINTLV